MPSITEQVASYVRRRHTCQEVSKPNQDIYVLLLIPLEAVEPLFTRAMIYLVEPIPPASAENKYLFTIMVVTTRYAETIPIQSIHAKVIVKQPISLFTHFDVPKELQ